MKTYTLEEIKELCEKASPNPWYGYFKNDAQKHEIFSGIYQTAHKIADIINYPRDFLPKEVEKADLEFIAASRTIVPQLLGQIESQHWLLQTNLDRVDNLTEKLQKAVEALRFYGKRNWASDGVYPSPDKAKETLKELGVE